MELLVAEKAIGRSVDVIQEARISAQDPLVHQIRSRILM